MFVLLVLTHSFCCRRKDHPRAAVLASWLVLVSPRAVSPNCWRASGRVDSEHAFFYSVLSFSPGLVCSLFVVCLLFAGREETSGRCVLRGGSGVCFSFRFGGVGV